MLEGSSKINIGRTNIELKFTCDFCHSHYDMHSRYPFHTRPQYNIDTKAMYVYTTVHY